MIGKKLVDVREFNNLKQFEMANILGVSRSHYSTWEINKETIPLKKLNILCNYFDISMDYMTGFSKEKNGNGEHEIDYKLVGKRVKEVRINNNLTQDEFAKVLNTEHSTISRYESGQRLVLTDFAVAICRNFDISMDWLCGRV